MSNVHKLTAVNPDSVQYPVATTPVRLLAANADGFHSSCVRAGPSLIDSEISFTGDDALNIHSRMSIVIYVYIDPA